jgi:hypothetical protein
MKKLLFAAVVVLFLPKAHASCTGVTVTPSTFTLQAGQTQIFKAKGTSCTGTPTWSCNLPGKSSCGTFTPTTPPSTSVTYTAGPTPTGSAETVTITATFTGPSSGTATVNVTAVQINSLLGFNSLDTPDFQTTVLGSAGSGAVTGVNPLMAWNSVESNTVPQTYDFTTFDQGIAALFTPSGTAAVYNKKINIIVAPVTGGCAINRLCDNSYTPTYVLSQVDKYVNNCNYGMGAGFPAVFENGFQSNYEKFITAVLQHYSPQCSTGTYTVPPCSSGNTGADGPSIANYLGYIRFGLSAGGEVYPWCSKNGSQTNYTVDPGQWISYIDAMDSYVASAETSAVSAGAPPVQMMTSINQNFTPLDMTTLPTDEANDAAGFSIGFGSQGWQKSDLNATTCQSDWCALFSSYHSSHPTLPLELQTVLQSDPTNVATTPNTGSLCYLVPFATGPGGHNATILEIYPYDMLYAFDTNYCNLAGASQYRANYCTGSGNGTIRYPGAYKTTLLNAADWVTPPPPLCGSN